MAYAEMTLASLCSLIVVSLEPLSVPLIAKYNPPLGLMTAAWFKIHLSGDTGKYHDLIFGDASDSLCKYADMKECMVEEKPSSVVV